MEVPERHFHLSIFLVVGHGDAIIAFRLLFPLFRFQVISNPCRQVPAQSLVDVL